MADDPNLDWGTLNMLRQRLLDQSDREFVLQQVAQAAQPKPAVPAPAPAKPAPVRYNPNRPASEQEPPQPVGGIGAKFQRLFGGGTDYDKYRASLEAENEQLRTRLMRGQVAEQEATRQTRLQEETVQSYARTAAAGKQLVQDVADLSDPQLLQARRKLENAAQTEAVKTRGLEEKAKQPGVEDRQAMDDALKAAALNRGTGETPGEKAKAEREAQDLKLVLGELAQQKRKGGPLSNVLPLWKAFSEGMSPQHAADVYKPEELERIYDALNDFEYSMNPINPAVALLGNKLDRDTRQNIYKGIGMVRAPFDEAYKLSQAGRMRTAVAQIGPPQAGTPYQGPTQPGQPPLGMGPPPAPLPGPQAPATQQDALRNALASSQQQMPDTRLQGGFWSLPVIDALTTMAGRGAGQAGPPTNLEAIGQATAPSLLDVLSALQTNPKGMQDGGAVGRPIPHPALGSAPTPYATELGSAPIYQRSGMQMPGAAPTTAGMLNAFPLTSASRDVLYNALKGGGDAQQAAAFLMLGLGSLRDREAVRDALLFGSGQPPTSIALRGGPQYEQQVMRTLQDWVDAQPKQAVKR